MTLTSTYATKFKTWWVQQPMNQAFELRAKLKDKLEWSDQQWYSRLNGKTEFTAAEKTVIESLTGFDFSHED